MIRAVAVISLLSLLVLVLYLPSVNPPERFLVQLRAEHQAIVQLWGQATATAMLSRAMNLQDSARQSVPSPMPAPAVEGTVQAATARELTAASQRLFDNAYVRSIDALVLLATFRLAVLLEWLPWLSAFTAVALLDGHLARLIKAREFRQHDPEVFVSLSCASIVAMCTMIIGFVLPVPMQPAFMPALAVIISMLLGGALANFHRRA
jgi:hypothetical protein